jgi:hypothetical protein
MRRSSYRGDPYWLAARYAGECASNGCSDPINKGDRIFYYPRHRRAYVGACAVAASSDFDTMAEAEDLLGGVR